METLLKKEIETTHSLWGIIDGEVLDPIQHEDNKPALLFEVADDTEDGTFPNISDYVRYVNSIESNGTQYFLNRYRDKKKRLDIAWDGVRIIRDADYSNEAELIFNEPFEIVTMIKGSKKITETVKRIKGYFTHEWYWTKNGRQQKIANGIEIWFVIEEYLE